MSQIIVTTRGGQQLTLEGMHGVSVMEIIRDGGVDEVLALCGGCCSCATCHVYVDQEFAGLLPPRGANEHELLDVSAHRRENSRLSCQITFIAALDGLRVSIAPED